MTAVSRAHGEWLRQQRQSRRWSVPQMVQKLYEAAESAGDKLPDTKSMIVMVYRWENGRSGVGQRYRQHYCAAFKIPLDSFGGPPILDALHADVAPPRSARDRMQAALSHIGDRAQRDQLCFELGYLCALMITATSPSNTGNGRCPAAGSTEAPRTLTTANRAASLELQED